MTSTIQIRCDLCNKLLDDVDVKKSNIIILNKERVKSKYHLAFTYDSVLKSGDLCFVCARKVRDYIEEIKGGKK